MRQRSPKAFTLIELLVVIAVIAILAAILFPVLTTSSIRAKVSRVHSDLRQIGMAIEMYNQDCGGYPPFRLSCSQSQETDYFEVPVELCRMKYIPVRKMIDPFNRTKGTNEPEFDGRPYKFIVMGWGYFQNAKTKRGLYIPKDYPADATGEYVYYYWRNGLYYKTGVFGSVAPPIKWAVWSVGPGGDTGSTSAISGEVPIPKKSWYPLNEKGVIVHFSDGRSSQ